MLVHPAVSPRSLPPGVVFLLLGGCLARNPSSAGDASSVAPRAAHIRPELPPLVADQTDAHACFPTDFETTRARILGDQLELCGLSRGAPRCYSIDPLTSFVRVIEVADAPRERPSQPVFDTPLTRAEISTRGARADNRGGTLSVVSASGQFRTVNPRSLGLSTLENAVITPWNCGGFSAGLGTRGPGLGAPTITETGTVPLPGRRASHPGPPGT